MALRFLLDEDMSDRVAIGLRARDVDAISVHEIDRANRKLPDEEQLAFAAEQGRVIVTYNRADYQALDAAWRIEGRQHAGIFWCSERTLPRRAIGDLIRALAAMAQEQATLEGLCLPLPRPPEQEG